MERIVTEICPYCDAVNTIRVNMEIKHREFKCSGCGRANLACSACPHTGSTASPCDRDEETMVCSMCRKNGTFRKDYVAWTHRHPERPLDTPTPKPEKPKTKRGAYGRRGRPPKSFYLTNE